MKKLFMKPVAAIALITVLMGSVVACTSVANSSNTNTDNVHNARNSLDYDGIYRGVLPCADCEGINSTVYLNRDNTFKITETYVGKGENSFDTSGTFSWNKAGNTITLKTPNSSEKRSYFVGENTLTQLDQTGNKIEGNLAANYILSKDNYALLNKKWRPIELLGKPVILDGSLKTEPTLTFDDNENRYIGITGCNNISGGFEILPFNKLKLSAGMSTMMACENMEIEQKLGEVLRQADGFIINADELILIKARMAPLARFKVAMH